jgi:mono/diheme cytochrome c family protein
MLAFCNDPGITGDAGAAKTHASAATVMAPADEAKQIAQTRCAMCHGQAGKGDGPNGMTLNPKPQDLTTKEWQKSVSDAQVRSVILKGGAALGKSPLMPANPDLESKPAVADELVKIVRGYSPP